MKDDKSPKKIRGLLSVSIITFIIFSLGFLPIAIGGYYVLIFIPFDQFWHLFLIPFIIYIGFVTTLFYQLLISGLIIHLFNIKYEPGTYDYTFANKMAYKWIVLSSLYTPIRKIIEIIPMGKAKYLYYRMLGMKIGENTLIGGTIMDPCLTEIGDNCTMGLFACIYGHIHDYEKGIIILDKIKIGNNCIIGAGAYIMPGAVLEDNVKLAAGSVVIKGHVLKIGKVYGGIPAMEIKSKRRKK
jgi:acetyltransferase-like isoleucine patch superfamily enzyme